MSETKSTVVTSMMLPRRAVMTVIAICLVCIASLVCVRPAYAQVVNIKFGDSVTYLYDSATAGPWTPVDGVTFDGNSTLTMANANIVLPAGADFGFYIEMQNKTDTITVKLVGDNKITGPGDTVGTAFAGSGNIQFAGSGSLSISQFGSGVKNMYADIAVGKGVKMAITNCKDGGGLTAAEKVTVSAGATVTASNVRGGVSGGNVVIAGTVNVTDCSSTPIFGSKGITIKSGASVTAKTSNPYGGYALWIDSGYKISNPAGALKAVKGKLGLGAKFKKGGSTYQVTDGYASRVKLVSYGGDKKAKVDTVKYGGATYTVFEIGKNAFNTAKGKKVTKITLGRYVYTVNNYAFKNTKSLTVLDVSASPIHNNNWVNVKVGKKAFKNCGKGGGAKLKVKTGWSAKSIVKQVKKNFTSHGMSKKATYVK